MTSMVKEAKAAKAEDDASPVKKSEQHNFKTLKSVPSFRFFFFPIFIFFNALLLIPEIVDYIKS
jgi:hypothetical protein